MCLKPYIIISKFLFSSRLLAFSKWYFRSCKSHSAPTTESFHKNQINLTQNQILNMNMSDFIQFFYRFLLIGQASEI